MSKLGMDVTDVRTLATSLNGASATLTQLLATIDTARSHAWWIGPDADQFGVDWMARSRPTVRDAAAALREAGAALGRQIAEQERASAADDAAFGGPRGTTGPPSASASNGLFGPLGDLAGVAAHAFFDGIHWLAGPDGPKISDLTARVPGLQEGIGDFADWAMSNPHVAGVIGTGLGFEYVAGEDFYTTNEHSLQSYLGFHDAYDLVGKPLGMDLDDEVMEFSANGTEYRLELWRGSYGYGGAFGGEIGLYTRDEDATGFQAVLQHIPGYYSTAQGADQIQMTQTIYDRQTGEVYFTNEGQGADDGDHFWNLAIRTDPGVSHEDIGQMGTLYVQDPAVRDAMVEAMRAQGLDPVVNEVDGSVSYVWED